MDELRSTEILDKEIKEDARKKAERILKNADIEVELILADVANRVKKTKTEKESLYSARIAAYKNDIEASVPLEKLRKRIAFIDTEVNKALDDYFEKIGEDKRLKIIKSMLASFTKEIQCSTLKIKYAGYKKEKIEKFISVNFKNLKIAEYEELSNSEAQIIGLKDGIFAEDITGSFICKASIDEAKKQLLTEKREELKLNLFGDSFDRTFKN